MMGKKMFIGSLLLVMLVISFLAMAAPAGAASRPKVEVEILSAKIGGNVYNLCFAAAEILKKHHPWIRATALETGGPIENCKTIAGYKTERRKRALGDRNIIEYWRAVKGKPPYDKVYADNRFVAVISGTMILGGGVNYYTLNPKIKTFADLAGKRIAIGSVTSAHGVNTEMILRGAGVWDKAKKRRLHYKPAAKALTDGLLDAIYGWTYQSKVGKWSVAPFIREVMAARKVYLLSGLTKEGLQRGMKEMDFPKGITIPYGICPAGALKKGTPAVDIGSLVTLNYLACWKGADEELIYEIVKTLVEHRREFTNYQKTATYLADPKVIAGVNTVAGKAFSDAELHPGALKYYREKGFTK